jgi:hypothetical protein
VRLEQVDLVGAESAQRRVDRPDEPGPGGSRVVRPVTGRQAALGRDEDGAASASDRLSQHLDNLLVFAVLGLLAPLRFAALASALRILALAADCSVLVEAAQYVLRLDRLSSVGDVLLNTAGAGLAAPTSRRWCRR